MYLCHSAGGTKANGMFIGSMGLLFAVGKRRRPWERVESTVKCSKGPSGSTHRGSRCEHQYCQAGTQSPVGKTIATSFTSGYRTLRGGLGLRIFRDIGSAFLAAALTASVTRAVKRGTSIGIPRDTDIAKQANIARLGVQGAPSSVVSGRLRAKDGAGAAGAPNPPVMSCVTPPIPYVLPVRPLCHVGCHG